MWTPSEGDERPDRREEMGLPTLAQFAQLADPCIRYNRALMAEAEVEAAERCYDRAAEILAEGGRAARVSYENVWGDMIAAGVFR